MVDINAANWAKLCAWMEPPPAVPEGVYTRTLSPLGWWRFMPLDNGGKGSWGTCPRNLDACALAEAEIERRGLAYVYTFRLLSQLNYSAATNGFWVIITATPAQRCAAMVAVIEASHA